MSENETKKCIVTIIGDMKKTAVEKVPNEYEVHLQ